MPVVRGSGYNLTGATPAVSSWGANIFPASPGSNTWHMYAAEFEENCDISHWSPNSAIIHAISTTGADGPYSRKDVAVPPFAHNPKVVQAPDGTWLMYTIGVKLAPSDLTNCSKSKGDLAGGAAAAAEAVAVPAPPSPSPHKPGRNPGNRESNVTLYTSQSLEGPWTKFGVVLGPDFEGTWDEDTSNPSPWVLANGTILLMYRGCIVGGGGCHSEYMGIASAPDWRGPYTRIGSGPILPKVMAEDPSLWVDKRGNFHYLMHYIPDATLVARHAFATHYDGPWMIHEDSIPYNSTVQFTDGGETTWEKRERPHLVFNDQKDPAWLVTGAVLPGAAGGYHGGSFTLIQQIKS